VDWLEIFYTGILVLVFLFVGWFSIYVVYKLYQGQR
jgi:cell division protein FtsL